MTNSFKQNYDNEIVKLNKRKDIVETLQDNALKIQIKTTTNSYFALFILLIQIASILMVQFVLIAIRKEKKELKIDYNVLSGSTNSTQEGNANYGDDQLG